MKTAISRDCFIPFNKPYMDGRELHYIAQSYTQRKFSGDGPFGKAVEQHLSENYFNNKPVHLVPSGTAAIELALLSLNLKKEDEVIVPSFTFVSCANAVLIAGGTPVFADISHSDQNISLTSIKNVCSEKTKAIMVVHYAGFSCDIEAISNFCLSKNITLIEDAAHCIGSTFNGKELGTFGSFGCFSFHETKNLQCGEGGALLINDEKYISAIEIIREKGTDRSKFLRGEVDKYTWRSKGSSYLLSEINAAFLHAQLESAEKVISWRKNAYNYYTSKLSDLEKENFITLPKNNPMSSNNGHIVYFLLNKKICRFDVIEQLKRVNIQAVSHYIPLHNSPMGVKYKSDLSMINSDNAGSHIVRLPIWFGLNDAQIDIICASLTLILKNSNFSRS